MSHLSAVSDTTPGPTRLVTCLPCVEHYADGKAAEYGNAIVAYALESKQNPLEMAERYKVGIHRQHPASPALVAL